jgi:hypothetical protein
MVPDFVDGANLPPGGHRCSWGEVLDRFGRGPVRQHLCAELRAFLERARDCGFVRVAIGGSFSTLKECPGDLDLLFVVPIGTVPNQLSRECGELLDPAMSRPTFGHDFMFCHDDPETFQTLVFGLGYDTSSGKDRGMLIIELEEI